MAVIRFSCVLCGAEVKVDDPALVGKKVRCPGCTAAVTVRAPSTVVLDALPVEPEPLEALPVEGPRRWERRRPDRHEEGRRPVAARRGLDWVVLVVALVVLGYAAVFAADMRGAFGDPLPSMASLAKDAQQGEPPDWWFQAPPEPPRPVQKKEPLPDPIDLPAWGEAEERWNAQREQKRLALAKTEQAILEELMRAAEPTYAGLESARLPDPGPGVRALAFSPDAELLASSAYGVIKLWALRTGALRRTIPVPDESVTQLAFSPDGALLAAECSKAVRAWNVHSGAIKHELPGAAGLSFSADGRMLAFREHGEVKLRDVRTGAELKSLRGGGTDVVGLAFRPFGTMLAVRDFAGTIRLWDVSTGRPYRRTFAPGQERAFGVWRGELFFSPDGKSLAVPVRGQAEAHLRLCQLDTGEACPVGPVRPWLSDVLFHPDGKLLACRDEKGFHLWDLRTGLDRVPAQDDDGFLVQGQAFSPGGTLLAGCQDRSIRIWRVADLMDRPLQANLRAATKVAFVKRVGLSYQASLQNEATDETIAAVTRLPGLAELSLDNRALTDNALAHLKNAPDLRELDLSSNEKYTDAGLAHLKGLKRLRRLNLNGVRNVSDAGLAHLAGLTELTELRLYDTKVTAAGLAHLRRLTKLRALNLNGVRVTDESLAHLAGMKDLEDLDLSSGELTDAGLATLAGRKGLKRLVLSFNEAVTSKGMVHLRGLTQARELALAGTQIDDDGLVELKGLANLEELDISSTRVSDAGLAHLSGLTRLAKLDFAGSPGVKGPGLKHLAPLSGVKELNLAGTSVTDEGLADIKGLKQLEKLTLPTRVTDAGLAHLAGLTNLKDLNMYQMRQIKGPGLRHLAAMPRLTELNLGFSGVTDEGLVGVKDLKQLETLYLPPRTTDAGLAHVAGLTKLSNLPLEGHSGVKGPGLRHLAGLKQVTQLNLAGTGVDDAGLANLKGLTHLKDLTLSERTTNAGLAHLAALTELERLHLDRTKITDAGLAHLRRLPNLRSVSVSETAVTDEGVEALKKAVPDLLVFK
jgi:WD40 repeat protein/Leucine-rich repeat (LRR) protein